MAVHSKQYFTTTHEKQLISETIYLYISFQAFRQEFVEFLHRKDSQQAYESNVLGHFKHWQCCINLLRPIFHYSFCCPNISVLYTRYF